MEVAKELELTLRDGGLNPFFMTEHTLCCLHIDYSISHLIVHRISQRNLTLTTGKINEGLALGNSKIKPRKTNKEENRMQLLSNRWQAPRPVCRSSSTASSSERESCRSTHYSFSCCLVHCQCFCGCLLIIHCLIFAKESDKYVQYCTVLFGC